MEEDFLNDWSHGSHLNFYNRGYKERKFGIRSKKDPNNNPTQDPIAEEQSPGKEKGGEGSPSKLQGSPEQRLSVKSKDSPNARLSSIQNSPDQRASLL